MVIGSHIPLSSWVYQVRVVQEIQISQHGVWSEGLGVWGTCGSRTQTTAYPTSTNPTLPKYEPPGRRNGADETAEHHMATANWLVHAGERDGKAGGALDTSRRDIHMCESHMAKGSRLPASWHPHLGARVGVRTTAANCMYVLLITPRSFAFRLCTDIKTSPIFTGSASQQASALTFILSFEFYEKLGWACTEILLCPISGYEKLWCWCKSLLCHCVLEMVPHILNRFLTFIWRSLVFM